ncbi:MAG: cation:proton antiporter [archaeon]
MENIFFDIGIIIIIATIVGFIARLLKQPLIPSYIIAGVIIGPLVLKLIDDAATITILSEIGIAFLLFVVGIEFNFKKLRDTGMYSSVGSLIRMAFLFGLGYFVAISLGVFSSIEAVYLGLMIVFSSTMVVVKLLADKDELDTLHGRIIIGVLLMEDLVAILAMSALTTLDNFSALFFIGALFKGLLLFGATIALGRWVFPTIFKLAAKSTEILFLCSLTVCFLFTFAASSMGFSITVGAFLAGLSLANLPYNLEIVSRVKPLRDFFSTIFFVTLGMEIVGLSLDRIAIPLLVFTLFVVALKPLAVMLLARMFGYGRRTAFLTGITLAQTSEFALIIAAQGHMLGHISKDIFVMAVLLSTATLTVTSYLIKYDNNLYFLLAKRLRILDKIGSDKHTLEYMPEKQDYDVILVGYDRIAYSISLKLQKMNKKYLVIDFNPDLIRRLIHEKIPCIYGDVGDIEILNRLNFKKAEIVISTAPEVQDNKLLINKVKHTNPNIAVFVTANRIDEALEMYDFGADYVILPHFLGGDHVSILLEDVTSDINKLLQNKISHIEELRERKKRGHEHPHKLTHHT